MLFGVKADIKFFRGAKRTNGGEGQEWESRDMRGMFLGHSACLCGKDIVYCGTMFNELAQWKNNFNF